MLEVKKKDTESFESLIRRFTKKTIQSGKIIQAKKIRFHQKPISKRAQKAKAIRREDIKKQREYLRKIGKLDDLLDNKKKIAFKKKR
ncbi:MAG TPA: 30S ribosomal protein S21 [Patescibacteria group bacterium]|nr:30S ribosomal protein S21 [Patescibacteria group bacterium]